MKCPRCQFDIPEGAKFCNECGNKLEMTCPACDQMGNVGLIRMEATLGHYAFIPIPEFLDRWHDKDDQEKLIHFGMVITRERATIYNPDRIKRME